VNSNDISRRIVDFALTFRPAIVAAWLFILAISVWGVTKLQVSEDNRVFYSNENAEYSRLREFENKYLANHNIVFLLTRSASEARYEPLVEAVIWLTENSWRIANVTRVDSIHNYPVSANSEEDTIVLTTALQSACGDRENCTSTEKFTEPKQVLHRKLISADRNSFAVALTLELDQEKVEEIGKITDDVELIKREFRGSFPSIDIHHTGGIPMMHAFGLAAKNDSAFLAPIALAAILLLTWWLTSSLRVAAFLLAAGASSALVTLGFGGHYGLVLNPATSIASILIITLVVTSAMHFASSYLNDNRIYDTYRATVNAATVNLKPIGLTTLTSIAGFSSLTLADAPPIGELGVLAAIGVLVGTIHIFILGPICANTVEAKANQSPAQALAKTISGYYRSKGKISALLVTIVILCLGIGNLRINDDFVKYFDERFEFRTQTDFISSRLTGPNHLEIDAISDRPDGIFDQAYLAQIKSLKDFLSTHDLVVNTFALTDIFDEIAPLFGSNFYTASPEELAQFYLTYELSLSEGQSATDFVSNDRSSSRISISLGESDSTSISSLIKSTQDWSASNVDVQIVVTGENAPVANLTPDNFFDMIFGIGASLLAINILMALILRSLRLAVLCLVSTVLPIVIGFGAWGWFVGSIGLASVVVIAVTIGIVIDDAIHLLIRFRDLRRAEATYSNAVDQSVRIVGSAILGSSLALACGFSALTLSGFGVNSAMGGCTAIIVLAALLVDLTVLPWVLSKDGAYEGDAINIGKNYDK